MEENNINKNLEEDEELKALRLAALATLKLHRKPDTDESHLTDYSTPIKQIVSVPSNLDASDSSQIRFLQSDRHSYNAHSWRNQPVRRRGGGPYPKTSHRSNLIVISPVSLDDSKESEIRKGEKPASAIVLPQHKWCNSGNEDSMSPRTLRRTGPSRFNRHGSDSESSDSDFEDSDNDSASNETVLQDEPPEHFARLSPERKRDCVSESVEKKRRLSFQSMEPNMKSETFDKNETTAIYNCLKNPNSSYNYSDSTGGGYTSIQNQVVDRNNWGHSVENSYSTYNQYSSQPYSTDSSMGFSGDRRNSTGLINGESHVSPMSNTSTWQQAGTGNSYFTSDATFVAGISRIHSMNEHDRSYSDGRNSLSMLNEIQGCNSSWQDGEKTNKQYFSRDKSYANSRSTIDDNNGTLYSDEKRQTLSQSDLRLELTKRIQQEHSSKKEVTDDQNKNVANERHDHTDNWSSNRQRYSQQGDRIDDSHQYRNSIDQSYERERFRNERSSRRRERSLSCERRNERSLSRDRRRHEFDFDNDRKRHGDSYDHKKYTRDSTSNYDKDRNERSFSPDRNRRDRSSTPDRSSRESSSSRERRRYGRSSSRNRRSYKRSSSRERIKHDASLNQDRTKLKCSLSPNNNKAEQSSSQDKAKEESDRGETMDQCRINRVRNLKAVNHEYAKGPHDRGLSQEKSRQERSWSQDALDFCQDIKKHERSLSQDRTRNEHSLSQSRNRYERSLSRDRNRFERGSSQNRSMGNYSSHGKRYNRSSSRDKKYVSSSNQDKTRHENNSNQDKSGKNHQTSKKHKGHENNSIEGKAKQDSTVEKAKEEPQTNLQKNIPVFDGRQENRHEKIRGRSRERYRHQRSKSKEKLNKDRSRSPIQKQKETSSHKDCYERSQSRKSSRSSSSSSSSSSYTSKLKLHSVPSVIKSVPSKNVNAKSREIFPDIKSVAKSSHLSTSLSDLISPSSKRDSGDHSKLTTIKNDRVDGDQKTNASDSNKRMPVHMRLGAFPRKRLIQMNKDVEAAFVNSSSSSDSESVSTKGKRKNIRIFTDVSGNKSGTESQKILQLEKDKSDKNTTYTFREKSRRLKTYR